MYVNVCLCMCWLETVCVCVCIHSHARGGACQQRALNPSMLETPDLFHWCWDETPIQMIVQQALVFLFCFFKICFYLCACVYLCGCLPVARRGCWISWSWIYRQFWAVLYGCLETNSSPLHEQQVFLTCWPFLQPCNVLQNEAINTWF